MINYHRISVKSSQYIIFIDLVKIFYFLIFHLNVGKIITELIGFKTVIKLR